MKPGKDHLELGARGLKRVQAWDKQRKLLRTRHAAQNLPRPAVLQRAKRVEGRYGCGAGFKAQVTFWSVLL